MKKTIFLISAFLFVFVGCAEQTKTIIGSDNANLSDITLSVGTLRPVFDPAVTDYAVCVSNAVDSIVITGVAAEPDVAKVSNNGEHALSVGDNIITLSVSAEDETIKEYSVEVFKASTGVFVSQWQTDIVGASGDNQIQLPLTDNGLYDFTVDWGDGTSSHITEWNSPEKIHSYISAGTYTVSISGILNGFSFGFAPEMKEDSYVFHGDSPKLINISQWGPVRLGDYGYHFYHCSNLEITADDIPDLTGTTNMAYMFALCLAITDIPNIGQWDVSQVTNMRYMFFFARYANPEIGQWNVSNVEMMDCMFRYASAFNQDIGDWDVSGVTTMAGMFEYAGIFNQDIGDWDVSNVINMGSSKFGSSYVAGGMFQNAVEFNQDISRWDVSRVENMAMMFRSTEAFDQDISDWDVSNVTDMTCMFYYALSFNQDISDWNISRVKNMADFLYGVTMSTENYDAILTNWALLPALQSGVLFSGGFSQYSSAVSASRQKLIDDYNWTITDGGAAAP